MKREILSIVFAVALIIVLYYSLFSQIIAMPDISSVLATVLVAGVLGSLGWGFIPGIEDALRRKPDVIIQKDSLRFHKYPYLMVSKQRFQRMPNMVYAEITVENCGKIKAKECEVEITLKNDGPPYRSKVLSHDSTKTPNPMTVPVDADHGTIGFCPLCLNLATFDAVLPNHSLGVAGVFTGTPVKHGDYEIFGKVMYDEKLSKMISLGKVMIPNDLLDKAKIPNDIQVLIDQGGFAVYLELCQKKVRAKFLGHNNEEDIKKVFQKYLGKMRQIDNTIEDNGKLRRWKTISSL